MTDHEMIVRSAEAMGWAVKVVHGAPTYTVYYQRNVSPKPDWCEWQPLRNDAQAMALVKALRLDVEPQDERWMVSVWTDDAKRTNNAFHEELNRAIVECVAMMSAAERN